MKTDKVQELIVVDLFKKTIDSIYNRLSDESSLKRQLKYHNESFNNSLESDIKWTVDALQNVVDSFYIGYYEVESFLRMDLSNMEYTKEHNLSIVNSANKLIKFIQ